MKKLWGTGLLASSGSFFNPKEYSDKMLDLLFKKVDPFGIFITKEPYSFGLLVGQVIQDVRCFGSDCSIESIHFTMLDNTKLTMEKDAGRAREAKLVPRAFIKGGGIDSLCGSLVREARKLSSREYLLATTKGTIKICWSAGSCVGFFQVLE